MERKGKNNNDYVSRRIFELMSHRGIKDSELERKIGLGRGMVSHWRHDRRNTYLQYINEICDCLNTTPNYLFRGTEQQEPSFVLSPIEKDLILMYRTFDEKMKKYIKDGFELLTKMKLY